jgi:hypothetical protein
MSARYMLDTNICIYLGQNRPPELTRRFHQMQHGDAVTSVITHGELHCGVERSQQRILLWKLSGAWYLFCLWFHCPGKRRQPSARFEQRWRPAVR